MTIITMQDLSLTNKRVLIREDFNVPMKEGEIRDDRRLLAAIPTIKQALQQQAKVMLLSHLGRPNEGEFDEKYSLKPVAARLSQLLNREVGFCRDWIDGVTVENGQVVLLENVRFLPGEKANDSSLANKMAALCDVFVMDAFATAHRAQASTVGVAHAAPIACAGPLLSAELAAIDKALKNPKRPLLAIVGGAKVSSKLALLESIVQTVETLIVGGGIANTFLAAQGHPVERSLYEPDLVPKAQQILDTAKAYHCELPLPSDVVVATAFAQDATPTVRKIDAVQENEMILDIGPQTTSHYVDLIKQAQTIVWNGPVGVFEWSAFAEGTAKIANAIAKSTAYSMAGGGDTLAAIAQFNVSDHISYISTGGGAFLETLEGKTLPAVAELVARAKETTLI